jgi:DNA-binding response OmpR family regulator
MQHKIMVVDDDVHVRESLISVLNEAGFKVLTVPDESTVLEQARTERPSLIILDLMLPKTPGLEICRQLKADATTQHIPVIMLTARTTVLDKVTGFQIGADDYVTKPFNPRELVLRINRSLLN